MRKKDEEARQVARRAGQVMRQFRKGASMTQSELAKRLGISYQQVQKYENGSSQLTIARLMQVSRILKVPRQAFFGEDLGGSNADVFSASHDEAEILRIYRALDRKRMRPLFRRIADAFVSLG